MSAAEPPPLPQTRPHLRLSRSPLQHGGQPLARLDAALLAWLALEGPTPRERLAALLWPHSGADAARNSLRQRLFKLKRQGGIDLVVGATTLALADGITHDLEDAALVLGDIELGIGPAFDAWLAQQRARRVGRVEQSLSELCEMAERAGDWPDALTHASELVALAPLSEPAHRRLMRLHYLSGDCAAALLAFDRCEGMLKDEIGARPSAETLALLSTIEQAQASQALPTPLASGRAVPAAVLRPPRLVGRAAQWQTLEEVWSRGGCALVSGEGGLGKSRLACDFAAARGVALVASARPGDERTAYASFSRLLRELPHGAWDSLATPLRGELARLLPELGEAPTPPQGPAARARFFNAVAALFGPGALVTGGVVFDDLHFADEASVELLQYVIDARPSRWLLTARVAESASGAQRLIEAWPSLPESAQVAVLPLTLGEVIELLDSLGIAGLSAAQVAPALLQRSGGNPLFLLETLKAGWLQGGSAAPDKLPAVVPATPGVHALIERRISRLSAAAVQLARCAAVAAPDFSAELAAHVLALRTIDLADPWAELEAAQVLVDGAFAHDLIYEAALASVPAPVARQLHAEVADFLSRRGGDRARLASHWAAAGRWAEAGAASREAATRARHAGRASDAATLLAEAAAAFEHSGSADERFDALLERARLLVETHADRSAVDAVDAVQHLARDPAQRLAALEVQLALAMARGETHRQLQVGREALANARELGRSDLELRLALLVADALCDLRQAAEAVALLEPYADWSRAHAAPELLWDYWCGLGMALDYADRLREALPIWDEAQAVALRAGRADLVWKAMANGASTRAKMGFVRIAAQQVEQACRIAAADDKDEHSVRVHQTRSTLGHRLRDLGHLGPALTLFESALAVFEAAGAVADIAGTEHRLAQVFQQLGQPARAAQLLDHDHPGLSPGLALMRQVHRADVAHQLGRESLPQMRLALTLIDNHDDVYHRIASLFAIRLLPPDEGEVLATSLAAWASARERLGVALAGHVRAAACALALGAPQRARPHADAALHLAAERQPDSFYLPEMWLVAGRVAAALGDVDAAAQRWREGATWVRRTCAEHVPPAFQDSFRRRNRINAELLSLSARKPEAVLPTNR